MANKTYKPILIDSVKAIEDIEERRFIDFFGKHCTAGARAYGVSDVSTAKSQFTPVAVLGVLLIEAGGTFAVGDAITSDNEGKGVKAEGSACINGYALDDATTGDLVRILVK